MKFLLMMHAARGTGDWDIFDWPEADRKAHIECFRQLNQELREAGEYVGVEALTAPRHAKIVRAGENGGDPVVTDGPFPEGKEFLAGFWIVDVANKERAYAIAARASAAPGPGGAPLGMRIEVREVPAGPPPT